MGVIGGLAACLLASALFGTMNVPIRRCSVGNGLFNQWMVCTGFLFVGLFVNGFTNFPQFQPLACLGGAFWALGNLTAVPVMGCIGLGMGLLIWGTMTCVVGWAAGRFGLFGIHASVPANPLLNYFGLFLVLVGGFLFSRIRPRPVVIGDAVVPGYSSVDEAAEEDEQRRLLDAEANEGEVDSTVHTAHNERRITYGIILSVFAGCCYGLTFVPVIYIQDHKEKFHNAPTDGLSYAFSHYCGTFALSTVAFLIYAVYTQNQPFVNPKAVLPGFVAGLFGATAQSMWFIANDALSQAVSFPIVSMFPGIVGTLWGIFYFHEIRDRKNLQRVGVAILITLTGATLVGVSK